MKSILNSLLAVSFLTFSTTAFAEKVETPEKAEPVVMEGSATCAKCDLEIEDECTTVLQVKDGEKTLVYYLSGEADQKWHKKICKKSMDVRMTGTVSEEDGKQMFAVTEIEEVKEGAEEGN